LLTYDVSLDIQLTFNCKKSCCVAFGLRWWQSVSAMSLGDQSITWCESIKYLGVNFSAGPSIKVDTDIINRNFIAGCNAILGNSVCQPELARLSLMESYCLPVFQYIVLMLFI